MCAWCIGIIAFVFTTAFVSHDLFLRVEIGAIAGAGASAAAMALLFRARARQGIAAGSLASLIEQIEYEPLAT
jgi:hypothetical protein